MRHIFYLLLSLSLCTCLYAHPDSLSVYVCNGDTCKIASQRARHAVTEDSVTVQFKYVALNPGHIGFNYPAIRMRVDSVQSGKGCVTYYGKETYWDTPMAYLTCNEFAVIFENLPTDDGILFSTCKTKFVDFDGRRVTCLY